MESNLANHIDAVETLRHVRTVGQMQIDSQYLRHVLQMAKLGFYGIAAKIL